MSHPLLNILVNGVCASTRGMCLIVRRYLTQSGVDCDPVVYCLLELLEVCRLSGRHAQQQFQFRNTDITYGDVKEEYIKE